MQPTKAPRRRSVRSSAVDFHTFYGTLPAPSSDEMERVLPVDTFFVEGLDLGLSSIASNWELHSLPYIAALEWFEFVYLHLPDDTKTAYDGLSALQKTILHRGYQIRYEGRHPPQFARHYYIAIAAAFTPIRPFDFPATRFRADLPVDFTGRV